MTARLFLNWALTAARGRVRPRLLSVSEGGRRQSDQLARGVSRRCAMQQRNEVLVRRVHARLLRSHHLQQRHARVVRPSE